MIEYNLNTLNKTKYFNSIDIHFAHLIDRLSKKPVPDVALAAALASHVTISGDVCLDLAVYAERTLDDTDGNGLSIRCPKLDDWRQALLSCSMVGTPGMFRPLILDGQNRLYLYRYWEYESRLVGLIEHRLKEDVAEIDISLFKSGLERLFPESPPSMQKIAAIVAVHKRFCTISGGPGTGKTHTVSKILALLLEQHPLMNVALAAPTGKAATRLMESIEATKAALNCSDTVKRTFPDEAYTIHRLLKPIPGTPNFQHHAENPLAVDLIVVDEASMVDLALMSKLFQAVPKTARMILIGDKDQLSSVEAGSVLGDICGRDRMHGYSENLSRDIEPYVGENPGITVATQNDGVDLRDSIVVLEKSYRFPPQSGIGQFSQFIKTGLNQPAMELLENPIDDTIRWIRISSPEELYHHLSEDIRAGYGPYLESKEPHDALEKFNRFRIFCAVNKGFSGIEAVNRYAKETLASAGLIQPDQSPWYNGRPILITRNDYSQHLFNGDMGVALSGLLKDLSSLVVCFTHHTGELRQVPPHRLSEHDTAFAITVHKSQGSEFDHIVLVLPEFDSPVLTRELVYTGVTRARKTVTIYGTEAIIRTTISRSIHRTSGLRDALWH